MARAVLQHRRPWLGIMLGLGAYVLVGSALLTAIASVTEYSADSAMRVVDRFDRVGTDEAAVLSEIPRAFRGMESDDVAVPAGVESSAFEHARSAPMMVGRLTAEQITELKDEVSERVVTDDASPWHAGERKTYKTMCVRLCDGAYFPISFATSREHFAKDEAVCAARCASPARLFVFPNPGGTPDLMRDRSGHAYLALPTAYQFRKGPVAGCSCQAQPWESASRDRHRLYALEESAAAGRPVDVAELARLREALRGASVAQSEPASGSAIVTAGMATTAVRRTSAGADTTVGSERYPPEPFGRPDPTWQLRAEGPRPIGGTALPAAPQAKFAARQAVRLHIAADRGKTLAAIEGVSPIQTKWTPEDQSHRSPPADTAAVVESDSDSAKDSGKEGAERKASPRRTSRKQPSRIRHVKADPDVRALPDGLVERKIWGVGRNAHGLPRGGSALESFARNFY